MTVGIENGFTKIANEILDAMAKAPLNGSQRRIIDVLWRSTYGYGRKAHELSETFISEATGITKRQIQRELKALIDSNIILVKKQATFSASRVLEFNKYYETWKIQKSRPQEGSCHKTVTKKKADQDRTPKKDKTEKDTETLEYFESIWKLYPNKKGKADISNTQKTKLAKISYEEWVRIVERYVKDNPDPKYQKHGSTFFNKGYLDYVDSNYTSNSSSLNEDDNVDYGQFK